MTDIKVIHKDTDISKLQIRRLPWDVWVKDIPYYVVWIEGYVHTIGGKWGDNNLWMYPRNEEPTYENLVEFNGEGGALWGIEKNPKHYIRTKWGETECFTSNAITITRNGEPFHVTHGIHHALDLINQINEHPLDFNEIDFDKNMIGRKVWWRSEPAVVTRWIGNGQACVILEPDGIEKFTVPAEFAREEPDYYCDGDVKTSVFDKHIWWFRE